MNSERQQNYNFRTRKFKDSDYKQLKLNLLEMMKEAFYNQSNKIELSENDKSVLNKVFNWLLGIGINENENKGLFLTGNFGVGKSTVCEGIIKFIEVYYSFRGYTKGCSIPQLILSLKMAELYLNDCEVEINKLKTCSVLAIDDIGREPKTINNYGTIICPFEDILMTRYMNKKPVILTSNSTLKEIGEKYGYHIYDRLIEMVYELKFEGKSKRK